MEYWLQRLESLIGTESVEHLKRSSVLLFGLGGVGGHALECLVRAGIGRISAVDSDVFAMSNLNRQLLATLDTVGTDKTAAAAERVKRINPECDFIPVKAFADADNIPQIISDAAPDVIIDAIDSVKAKLDIASYADEHNISLISCMGTGNKLDPSRLKISDISKTSVCPLAKAVRCGLRTRGIRHLPVVFSDETPFVTGNRVPASISFVPSAAGILLAGWAVRRILGISSER